MAWTSRIAILACALIVISCAYIIYDLNGESLDFSDSEVILVVTDSMDGDVSEYAVDSYPADTLAIVKSIPAHEILLIRVGQVVAYHDGDKLITHRVVDVDTKNHYLTVKGDNSSSEEIVAYEKVAGVVAGTNSWLGVIISVLKTNMELILCFFVASVVCLAVYKIRKNVPTIEKKGVRRGVAYALAFTAVAGIVLVGAGYAYTTSTENSGNDVSSEYVVLTQGNYNFTAGSSFEYYSITKGSQTTKYYIFDGGLDDEEKTIPLTWLFDNQNGGHETFEGSGVQYYGVLIGRTTLKVDLTNYVASQMSIQLLMAEKNVNFTYFGSDWRYLLKVYYEEDSKEKDIQWLWSKGNGWNLNLKKNTGSVATDRITIDPTKEYKVELYFGGPKATVEGVTVAGSSYEPKGIWLDGRQLINDGWIKFSYSLTESEPMITFNPNDGTVTMKTQNVTANVPAELKFDSVRTGYIFKGWSTDRNATVAEYQKGDEITTDKSLTLYAVWQKT